MRFGRVFIPLLILIALLATRLPYAAGQIFSFDDINLTYAVDEFNIHKSQPQPPGYPLFVLQQKLFRLIGFKNPVSNLTALALAGAFAALLATRWCGRLVFGGYSGTLAAWLLLLHPTFWYTTLTSALRVQLALISAAVAATCWRAWNGETKWIYASSVALGLGAGIRPELGPLLFPLWCLAVVRSSAPMRTQLTALGILTVSVGLWLFPLVALSGGLAEFFRVNLSYLAGQDTMKDEVLGMGWRRTAVWFAVWTFSGWLVLPVLLWLARGTTGLSRRQFAFFAAWMFPGAAFAILVHVADPGHTLALLVPATLLVAHVTTRAVAAQAARKPAAWDALAPILLLGPLVALPFLHPGYVQYVLLVLTVLAAILIPRLAGPRLSPAASAGFLLAPSLATSIYIFGTAGWYSDNPGNLSPAEFRSHMNSAVSMSNLDHYQRIVHEDDTNIRTIWEQTEAHRGPTLVIWERGLTEPRKLAYYARVPLIILEPTTPARPAPPLFTKWLGPQMIDQGNSAAPLRVPLQPKSRLLFVVKPKSPLALALPSAFPGQQIGDVYVADLPATPGEQRAEDFLFTW